MFSRSVAPHGLLCALIVGFAAAAIGAAAEPVVTIDAEALTATAEAPLVVAGKPNWRERDLRIGFTSTAYEPVVAVVKVRGLKAPSYDVYFSETFKGTFPAAEIDKGLQMQMSRGAAPVEQRKILESLYQPMKEASERMIPKDRKVWPFWHLYNPTYRWIESLLSSDESVRKARMIFTESGYATRPLSGVAPPEIEQIQKRYGMLLQDIEGLRNQVAASSMEAERKAEHLGAIVPVGLFLRGDEKKAVLTIRNDFGKPFEGTLEIVSPQTAFAGDTIKVSLAPGQEQKMEGSVAADGGVTVLLKGSAGGMQISRKSVLRILSPLGVFSN